MLSMCPAYGEVSLEDLRYKNHVLEKKRVLESGAAP